MKPGPLPASLIGAALLSAATVSSWGASGPRWQFGESESAPLPVRTQPSTISPYDSSSFSAAMGHVPAAIQPNGDWGFSDVRPLIARRLARGKEFPGRQAPSETQVVGTQREAQLRAVSAVSAIFEDVLADDRISASWRVLFARLQAPVARSALADPAEFLRREPPHPARLLAEAVGHRVLDAGTVATADGAKMEKDLKVIVSIVEAYPEEPAAFAMLHEDYFSGDEKHLMTLAERYEHEGVDSVLRAIKESKRTPNVAFRGGVVRHIQDAWRALKARLLWSTRRRKLIDEREAGASPRGPN